VTIFGRLAPGVSTAAAEAELRTVSARLAREFPAAYATLRPIVAPYVRALLDVHQYPAWIVWTMQLFGVLVLAAVAVTVSSLVYARTAARQAEIAVRTALGASRRRIITQLFVEALALSSLAAAIGLLIANFGFRQIVAINPGELPYWIERGLPPSTVAYAVGLAVLGAFIVGIIPALAATGQRLQSSLRQMGGATGMQLGKTWTALIVAQVGVAMAVLPPVIAIAWLTYQESRGEPTLPVDEMLTVRLDRAEAAAREAPAAPSVEPAGESFAETQAELIRRIAAAPGVLGVTYASAPPRSGRRVLIEVEGGVTTTSAARPVALSTGVAPDYFDVLGVQVLAGRPFGPGDAPGGAAAVVSRSFVRRFLGDGGRAVRFAVVMVGLVTLSVLLLSAVGISAMMSFAVTRRYREIGIRSALGASRRQVLRTIFSRSALQLGLGVAVGAIFTALLDRISGGEFLNGQEHVLVPMVAALVIVAGLLATARPARRALRVQPMEALRQE
jgi:putative ABC transport system permease protein